MAALHSEQIAASSAVLVPEVHMLVAWMAKRDTAFPHGWRDYCFQFDEASLRLRYSSEAEPCAVSSEAIVLNVRAEEPRPQIAFVVDGIRGGHAAETSELCDQELLVRPASLEEEERWIRRVSAALAAAEALDETPAGPKPARRTSLPLPARGYLGAGAPARCVASWQAGGSGTGGPTLRSGGPGAATSERAARDAVRRTKKPSLARSVTSLARRDARAAGGLVESPRTQQARADPRQMSTAL